MLRTPNRLATLAVGKNPPSPATRLKQFTCFHVNGFRRVAPAIHAGACLL